IYYYKEFWLVQRLNLNVYHAKCTNCTCKRCTAKLLYSCVRHNVRAQADQFIYQASPFFVLGFPFVAMRLAFTFFICLWFIQTGYRP
uniref:Uncharacterized protein n=1 Tax=Sinocyclocheilus rhinocerous TaxID=307959 RepID=A0A673H733_9TELE